MIEGDPHQWTFGFKNVFFFSLLWVPLSLRIACLESWWCMKSYWTDRLERHKGPLGREATFFPACLHQWWRRLLGWLYNIIYMTNAYAPEGPQPQQSCKYLYWLFCGKTQDLCKHLEDAMNPFSLLFFLCFALCPGQKELATNGRKITLIAKP